MLGAILGRLAKMTVKIGGYKTAYTSAYLQLSLIWYVKTFRLKIHWYKAWLYNAASAPDGKEYPD